MAALKRLHLSSWALSLLLLASCEDPERKQRQVAEEVETLSKDQCIRGWLSEEARRRLISAARQGTLAEAQVNAYISGIKKAIRESEHRHISVESFCRKQRNLWRQHIRP